MVKDLIIIHSEKPIVDIRLIILTKILFRKHINMIIY